MEQLSQLTCPPCPSHSLEWLLRAGQWAWAENIEKHCTCDPTYLTYAPPGPLCSQTHSSSSYLLKTHTHIVAELYTLNFRELCGNKNLNYVLLALVMGHVWRIGQRPFLWEVLVSRIGGMVLDGTPWVGRLMILSVCCHLMLPYWFRPGLGISCGLSCVPVLVLESLLLPQLFAETLFNVKVVGLDWVPSQHGVFYFGGLNLTWPLCPQGKTRVWWIFLWGPRCWIQKSTVHLKGDKISTGEESEI